MATTWHGMTKGGGPPGPSQTCSAKDKVADRTVIGATLRLGGWQRRHPGARCRRVRAACGSRTTTPREPLTVLAEAIAPLFGPDEEPAPSARRRSTAGIYLTTSTTTISWWCPVAQCSAMAQQRRRPAGSDTASRHLPGLRTTQRIHPIFITRIRMGMNSPAGRAALVGADWEQRHAPNGRQLTSTALNCAERHDRSAGQRRVAGQR